MYTHTHIFTRNHTLLFKYFNPFPTSIHRDTSHAGGPVFSMWYHGVNFRTQLIFEKRMFQLAFNHNQVSLIWKKKKKKENLLWVHFYPTPRNCRFPSPFTLNFVSELSCSTSILTRCKQDAYFLSHPSGPPLWRGHPHPPAQSGKVRGPGVTPDTPFFISMAQSNTIIYLTLGTSLDLYCLTIVLGFYDSPVFLKNNWSLSIDSLMVLFKTQIRSCLNISVASNYS